MMDVRHRGPFKRTPRMRRAFRDIRIGRGLPSRDRLRGRSGIDAYDMSEITELLRSAHAGAQPAMQAAFGRMYEELHRIASARAGKLAPGATLSATELVHEAYLKLAAATTLALEDRRHFLVCAARTMRQIMVDRARAASSAKRGGVERPITLTDVTGAPIDLDLLDLDRALADLGEIDPDLRELVELRFFAGMDMEAMAELFDVSTRTLHRDWQRARALLALRLDGGGP